MIAVDDYLIWAESVVGVDSSEAQNRAAVSRAYYSLFHACEGFAAREHVNLIPKPEVSGRHEKLYSSFEIAVQSRIPPGTDLMTVRRIGVMANNLFRPYRVHADYHLGKYKGKDFTASYAMDAVAKARLLIDEIKKL